MIRDPHPAWADRLFELLDSDTPENHSRELRTLIDQIKNTLVHTPEGALTQAKVAFFLLGLEHRDDDGAVMFKTLLRGIERRCALPIPAAVNTAALFAMIGVA